MVMPARWVVKGQNVARAKVRRSQELRHAMTVEEDLLWRHLRRKALGGLRFRRQQVVDGFIVDFYCHAAGLVIEVDGPIHETRVDTDMARDRALAARGLHVIRVSNEDVQHDIEAVLARIWASTGIDGAKALR